MDKVLTVEAMVAKVPDGASIVFGGSSLSRKPMAVARELVRQGRRDLTLIVNIGGPEVDLLLGAGAVKKVVYAFVGFEILGLAPHFRQARQRGLAQFEEWTEYTVIAGLDATIKAVPFLPTRAGLGTDVLAVNPAFRRIADPFGSGQELVAVPALNPDFAFIHVNYADCAGNAAILGDTHIDPLAAKAARTTFVTCEKLVPPEVLRRFGRDASILRIWVDGVAEVPWGAHPTGCAPQYRFDLDAFTQYLEAAAEPERWAAYLDRVRQLSPEEYVDHWGGTAGLQARLRV
ncbi:MAG: CoA transferase subunit A [Firmicutes bacterium]|nr:CoA transferase subunit A [Alicyclobacillaceae bacterium]MCL6497462.1 CoA transferase subunit A [Bacillota bacterium]